MPISARFDGSRHLLETYLNKLENVDPLLLELAETLVVEIGQRVPRDSEEMAEIITRIRGPFNTPQGRAIGIGDATLVGPRGARAPTGTIKEFLKWYRDTQMGTREDKVDTAPPEEIGRPVIERTPDTISYMNRMRTWIETRFGLERTLAKIGETRFELMDRIRATREDIGRLRRLMSEGDPTTKRWGKWGADLTRQQSVERGQSERLRELDQRVWNLSDRINRIDTQMSTARTRRRKKYGID